MNIPILNREFKHPADGWYHIEPRGAHPNREAGIVQVIDGEACEAIANRFNADADAGTLPHGHEMLIDHEHFSHDADKETRAFGWLQRLQNRDDGIYGQIRWSTTGRAAVDGGDYRFFSTEYDPANLSALNREKNRVRPTALAGLTLTNRPNNKGGRPITNSRRQSANNLPDDPAIKRSIAAPTAGDLADIQNRKTTMKLIAQKLGLSADASEEAILGALDKVQNRATAAEAQVTPLTAEVATLKNRVSELDAEQIAADLDAHGVKDEAVRNRLTPVLSTMKNREERVAFLTEVVAKPAVEVKPQTKLFNRDGKAPAAGKNADTTGADKEKAQRIMNRAAELQKLHHNLNSASAVIMAQREIES